MMQSGGAIVGRHPRWPVGVSLALVVAVLAAASLLGWGGTVAPVALAALVLSCLAVCFVLVRADARAERETRQLLEELREARSARVSRRPSVPAGGEAR